MSFFVSYIRYMKFLILFVNIHDVHNHYIHVLLLELLSKILYKFDTIADKTIANHQTRMHFYVQLIIE